MADFDPTAGELPEGLAVDRQGNFYVGMALTGEIKRVTPDGEVSTFANLPPPGSGFMTGIAADRQGNLYVALASFDPATHGVWKVSHRGSNVERFASLPEDGLPNSPAFDHQGNLFVSDSFLGRVWKIDGGGNATVWKEDPLLKAAPGGPLNLPVGVNGIAFDHNQKHLYAVNTLESRLVRIPLNQDGSAGTVQAGVEDSWLVVSITDTGEGISEEDQKHVFERFYRVQRPLLHNVEGTGLGLTIAQDVARQYGGEVTLRSRWGEGTTVALRLRRLNLPYRSTARQN